MPDINPTERLGHLSEDEYCWTVANISNLNEKKTNFELFFRFRAALEEARDENKKLHITIDFLARKNVEYQQIMDDQERNAREAAYNQERIAREAAYNQDRNAREAGYNHERNAREAAFNNQEGNVNEAANNVSFVFWGEFKFKILSLVY